MVKSAFQEQIYCSYVDTSGICGTIQSVDSGSICHRDWGCRHRGRAGWVRKRDFTEPMFKLTDLKSVQTRQEIQNGKAAGQVVNRQAGQNTGSRYQAENQDQENKYSRLEYKCTPWHAGKGKEAGELIIYGYICASRWGWFENVNRNRLILIWRNVQGHLVARCCMSGLESSWWSLGEVEGGSRQRQTDGT